MMSTFAIQISQSIYNISIPLVFTQNDADNDSGNDNETDDSSDDLSDDD